MHCLLQERRVSEDGRPCGGLRVQVHDNLGRVVLRERLKTTSGTLGLEALPEGVYAIVFFNSGVIWSRSALMIVR